MANRSANFVTASAPGKLFLLGEYAVLEGAPALLTAVDRRATVLVTTGDHIREGERIHEPGWRISAPNLGLDSVRLHPDGSLPGNLDHPLRAHLRVFDAVRAAVLAHGAHFPDPLAITIDSSDFAAKGNKLGLGSSAAVAAALTFALARVGGLPVDRPALVNLAIAAHRAAQDGVGSGGDVAASVYGGLLSYTAGSPPLPLKWPQELTIMAVVTGTGSRTVDLVARVAAFADAFPSQYRADVAQLADLARQAQGALASPDEFLVLASAYFDALRYLDAHAQAGIISPLHLELHDIAAGFGATFKSSGAGGGDVGLAFSRTGDDTSALEAALEKIGARVVPLGFGAPGVQDGVY